jgi:hypothetical protein
MVTTTTTTIVVVVVVAVVVVNQLGVLFHSNPQWVLFQTKYVKV